MTAADPATTIGANIKRRRQGLGLSLEGLAKQSGVSSTMLSEVERSVKNPTVKLAYQIARALGCSLTDLLEDGPAIPTSIIRATERRTLVDPSSGVARHGITSELSDRGLEIAWYELPPGQSSGEMGANRIGVVEHLIVMEGEVEVVLGGDAHPLGPGDSIYYGPQTTTEYRNVGDAPATILLLSDSSRTRV